MQFLGYDNQRTRSWVLLFVLVAVLASTRGGFAGETHEPVEAQRGDSIAQGLLAISDVVLQHHIDPPTRQQMLLMGIKAVLKKEERPQPQGLSRMVSSLAGKQLVEFVRDAAAKSALSAEEFENEFLKGMLATVPGNASMLPTNEVKVAEQLQSNRYVGIGIALATDQDRELPMINRVFPNGPAAHAEAQDRDLILQVDGTDTHKMPLGDVVAILRGPEGTSVTIVVQQPDADASRTLEMIRGVVPIASAEAKSTISAELPVGYVRIESIRSSTVHELRQIERSMQAKGARAVVLDFRRVRGGRQHDSLLLADTLLDGGEIGRVLSAAGTREYQAQPDCLFNGWPMAVLVDGSTSGGAEWIAAALQDNGRATIFGKPSQGAGHLTSPVLIPGRDESIRLVTGVLQRTDGTSLVKPHAANRVENRIQFTPHKASLKAIGSVAELFNSHGSAQTMDVSAATPAHPTERWHVEPNNATSSGITRSVRKALTGSHADDRAMHHAIEHLRRAISELE